MGRECHGVGTPIDPQRHARIGRGPCHRRLQIRERPDRVAIEFIHDVADDESRPMRDGAVLDGDDQHAQPIRPLGRGSDGYALDAKIGRRRGPGRTRHTSGTRPVSGTHSRAELSRGDFIDFGKEPGNLGGRQTARVDRPRLGLQREGPKSRLATRRELPQYALLDGKGDALSVGAITHGAIRSSVPSGMVSTVRGPSAVG